MKALPIILLFSYVLLLPIKSSLAQEIYAPPPSETLTTLPIYLVAESVVLVRGSLEGHSDTLTFILDTGSSGISLDSLTADYLGLTPQESDINIRGIAGIRKALFLYNKSLKLGDEVIDSLNFHINDYSFMSYMYGVHIDGIIGYSLFSRYIVKLDYDSLRMEICSQGTIRYPRGGYLLNPHIRTLPVQEALVRDHRRVSSRFLFDIGAGLPLVLSEDFVQDSALIRKTRKRFPIEAQGVGGKIGMDMTLVRDFRLGPYRFRKVPAMVFEDHYNITSYPYMAGLIGNQILKRFNTIFNYAAGEIHIKPNSLYREPFVYSYSGMELYYINGLIVVGSVVEGSPADLAGIKENDIVITLNNDTSRDFATYKRILLWARKELTFIIQREEEGLQIIKVKLQRLR